LQALFFAYGITPPGDLWLGHAPRFVSLHAACVAAVQGEVANAAIYDRVLNSTTRPDILRDRSTLGEASPDRHQPAFRRCAERGGR
jgi:hypothetical protein